LSESQCCAQQSLSDLCRHESQALNLTRFEFVTKRLTRLKRSAKFALFPHMISRKSPSLSLRRRILLVDDNANGLAARKSVLEELGYLIVTCTSGADALEQFSLHDPFDLVVTDYKMPRMDGLELIGRLRKHTPSLPIVLISGYVDTLGLNEASTGADVVIQKSANEVSHLIRSVNRLLRRKSAKSQAALPKTNRKSAG
jgi:CheY-like chemotaxis protein